MPSVISFEDCLLEILIAYTTVIDFILFKILVKSENISYYLGIADYHMPAFLMALVYDFLLYAGILFKDLFIFIFTYISAPSKLHRRIIPFTKY